MAQGRVNGRGEPVGINRRMAKISPRGTGFAKKMAGGHSADLRFGGLPPKFLFQTFIAQEANLKSYIGFALICFALTTPALAQGLVDPSKVAPEYREAAEKRRAEQIRQRDCAKKAEVAKVMPRERTAFLLQCLAALEAAAANGTPPAAAASAPAPSAANDTTTH
jgi:hypothetical protein